ncbi:MAG: flagellar protein FlgN [Clostridiaceae bacterium]|nr:flagellar protein FlgN [Clostridiaceae bacterium]
MVNKVWTDNLIKVLEYENKLYKQFFAIAEQKTDIVVKGDVEALQTLVGKEHKLAGELNKLSAVREQIFEQISKAIGRNPKEMTLTDLIAHIPPEQASRVTQIRDELQKTIRQFTAKNDLNQKLIQNALEYVDFSLNLLTRDTPGATQYGRKGNETNVKNRGILDIKY